MFRAPHPLTAFASPLVPLPRRPLDESCQVRRWYERDLGWPTVPGDPVRLAVGVRFDVLDVPAKAGHASLRRLGPGSPVAVRGDRMRLLVAPGSAEELPGLLEWLEWGSLALDLTAIGAGGSMEAPVPAEAGGVGGPLPRGAFPPGPLGPVGSQGAAVWLRPPEPGCEVEASLPTLSALGGTGNAPDLVRLVDTVATHCHRVRLRRACAQPPALRTQGQ
ncbi:SCO3374 family protein [Streptomyces violaceus]|uniref:SCO3374 family protein n=1 Tax=Streptomyces violaceus TaxID=1936 RepID=UPI002E2DFCE6|nr:SCO3374 family protein [Streptomyces violaceus]